MTSVYEQARQAYRDWVNSGMKKPDIKPVSVPVVKTEVEKPKVDRKKVNVEKIHNKIDEAEKRRNPKKPTERTRGVISKQQLENTKFFWDTLPSNQYPIVRGLARVLSLDADSLPTHRAENLKSIIEIAVRNIGSGDESKIYQWVMQKMREGKISGERPEAQLRMYLAMK